MTLEGRRRMIVGVTGATGIIYAVRLLKALRQLEIETHLVISKPAEMAAACEWPEPIKSIRAGADVNYRISDISAAIASGSFRTMGMIVAPCSARTVAEIASGTSSNLLTRAADVCLKERRRLVLMVPAFTLLARISRVRVRGGAERRAPPSDRPARAGWAALRQFLFRAILFRDFRFSQRRWSAERPAIGPTRWRRLLAAVAIS